MKNTKKSLVASGISLAVSAALLIGTTFAWFTDSVTNSGNRIQAGNLDVALEEWNGETYAEVGSKPIFDYDCWEPGYSDIAAVRIANNGSLALQYELDIVADGEVSELADVIDVYYYRGGDAENGLPKSFGELDGNYVNAGTLREVLARENGVANGHLEAGQAGVSTYDYAIIVLHMQEEAGNEYQKLSIGADFDIVLKATQYTSEKDGFGNSNYDAGAAYPVKANVSDNESMKAALNNSGVPVDITLTDTIGNTNDLTVTGDVTMNLGENRLNKSNMDIVGAGITVENGGSLTINAVNAEGWAYTAGKLSTDGAGSTLTVNGGEYGDSGAGNANVAARNGSVIYLNEGSFSASGKGGHAVTAESGATVYIAGGSFSTSGAESSTIYANGGTIIITNLSSIRANGSNYNVDNGGTIILSKTVSPSRPTRVGTGCNIAEDGDNWVITKN